MILDERLEFCDTAALNTGAAGTYLVGDVIDLIGLGTGVTVIGQDTTEYPGNGPHKLYLVIVADVQADSAAGAATAKFTLASDAQAAIATDGSATAHYATAAIPELTLAPGYRVCAVPLPEGAYERYLGILQTTAGEAFTAGKISAFLTDKPENWLAAKDNVS